ncbi:MAG: hypothetical protein IPO27_14845 [Bacteroidetes bacterium]|nr:hypothetical protein [Bacteroidota bacterium]
MSEKDSIYENLKAATTDTLDTISAGIESSIESFKKTINNIPDFAQMGREKMYDFTNHLLNFSPLIEKAGYQTTGVTVNIGLPPKIIFHLRKFADLNDYEIETILKENSDKEILVMMIRAIEAADKFQQKITTGNFKVAEINIEVSIPPAVEVTLKNMDLKQ